MLVQVEIHLHVTQMTVRTVFSDISQVATLNAKLLVQIKDQQWGGEFVHQQEDQDIPDRSMLTGS